MKKSLIKNTIREIKNSRARFISIMAIIALGTGFFCGIKATAPSMQKMAENYYHRTQLLDYRLVSSVGFEDEDVDALKQLNTIEKIVPSYYTDVYSTVNESSCEVRVYADTGDVNKLTIVKGRLPEKVGEIVVEEGAFDSLGINIGETVRFDKYVGKDKVKKTLKTLEYKVVGQVRSPIYISYERGTTTIGDGKLDTFMYVHKDCFKSKRYTEIYLTTDFSQGATLNDNYVENIDNFKTEIEKLAEKRCAVFEADYVAEPQAKINKNQIKLDKNRAKAEKKFNKAEKDLINAQAEFDKAIADAENKIADGEAEVEDGFKEYYYSKEKFQKEISSADKKLKKTKKDLQSGKSQYNTGIKEYKDGVEKYTAAYEEFYNITKAELENKLNQAKTALVQIETGLLQVEQAIENATDADSLAALIVQKTELVSQKNTLTQSVSAIENGIAAGETELSNTKKTLDSSGKTLEATKKTLQNGQKQFKKGKKAFEKNKAEGKAQLADAWDKLKAAEAELIDAKTELNKEKISGQEKIDDGWKDFNNSKKETEKKFAKAQRKLKNAQKKLNELNEPEWYTFTRDDNPGYTTFVENTERVDSIAKVFPVFFMLVAVLVCLTTMTRLVDEKRTEIGTFKALGYSNFSIIGKFLIYSSIAGLVGAIGGIALGINTLPYIIYDAYGIMYNMDPLMLDIEPIVVVLSVAIALACTGLVSVFTCMKVLRGKPAGLMRPKGPKSGKRILLERIPFVWKRFGFTSKVTARNLFRYKTRMLMTVVGVAGCTALILAAFGLLDAISAVSDIQFKEIYKYNTVVVAESDMTAGQIDKLNKQVSDNENISHTALTHQTKITVEADGCKEKFEVTAFVPENIQNFNNVVTLRDRENHKLHNFGNGVIITEKLSKMLGVKVGEKIRLETDDASCSLKIDAITEQYVGSFVYMTSDVYEKNFGETDFNIILAYLNNPSQNESSFSKEFMDKDDVMAVSFITSSVEEFDDMVDSLNTIVFIMILCAGMLAFVVLYNLTNINIAERIREIATLKVLGFNNKETGSYIYRENIALLIMGIASGLLLGIWLNNLVINTIEMDNVMFGREIYLQSYIYAAALTALFATIVNFFMFFKMKKVNMVESLKSVE